MASQSQIKQIAAIGLIEGLFSMLWDQKYADNPHNKTFKSIYDPLVTSTAAALRVLRDECGGLSPRELRTLQSRVNLMRMELFGGASVDAMDAVSMCIDLCGSILIKINPGTAKANAIDDVLTKVKAFERYYNRKRTYDDPAGLDAAEKFKHLLKQPMDPTLTVGRDSSPAKGTPSCQP